MDTNDKTYEWNNYIITKEYIGKGSFSKVYYGYHKETKQEIALKRIVFNRLENNIKNKVISEIMILQQLHHDNIIKLYEYKFDGDYIFLVTEYCNNNDLSIWMKQEHTIEEKIDIIKQITNGIHYLHEHRILHRDIKPQNILLHNGLIKICDFGFSLMIKEQLQMCMTICGTPLFMSPELLFMKPYTIKSEIWSLGILFYMIVYNVHPFGILYSLDDYRSKIKNKIKYTDIKDMEIIMELLQTMLSYDSNKRPDISTIHSQLHHKLLYNVSLENIEEDYVTIPKPNTMFHDEIEQKTNKQVDQSKRIEELEEHIFKLESIVKEKEVHSSLSCCFNVDDDEVSVTGRGRTNKEYEITYTTIKPDYFTPPSDSEIKGIPIPITKKLNSNHPSSSYQSSSGSSKGSFLSNSFDKLLNMFYKKTP